MSTLTVKGISLNLSRPFDTERLMTLSHQPTTNPADVKSWYITKMQAAFKDGNLYGQEVDFFCFQEFYPEDPEKQGLVDVLHKAGFTILGNGDLGIAFEPLSPKGERFLLQGSPHGVAPQALKPTFRRL